MPWLTHNLNAIEAMVERLNKGAHPGSFTMVQASTEMPGFQQLGAKFDRELLGDCLSLGTAAMALLLCEIEWLFPDISTWQDEFKSLQKERNEWFRAAYGEDSSVDVLGRSSSNRCTERNSPEHMLADHVAKTIVCGDES